MTRGVRVTFDSQLEDLFCDDSLSLPCVQLSLCELMASSSSSGKMMCSKTLTFSSVRVALCARGIDAGLMLEV